LLTIITVISQYTTILLNSVTRPNEFPFTVTDATKTHLFIFKHLHLIS